MMQQEWTKLTGHNFTDEEWDVIHEVYQWHPAISDNKGKQDLLTIYKLGGYRMIFSMAADAKRAEDLSEAVQKANLKMEQAQRDRDQAQRNMAEWTMLFKPYHPEPETE